MPSRVVGQLLLTAGLSAECGHRQVRARLTSGLDGSAVAVHLRRAYRLARRSGFIRCYVWPPSWRAACTLIDAAFGPLGIGETRSAPRLFGCLRTRHAAAADAAGVIADTAIDLVATIGRAILTDLPPERRTRTSPAW